MTNPYAPPQAVVRDIADPDAVNLPADRGARLGAAILDSIIFILMVYLPLAIGVLASAAVNDRTPAMIGGFVLGAAGFAGWCWITVVNVKRSGQSMGKKMVGIRVVRRGGAPVSLGRVFWLRNVVNALLGAIPFYALVDILFIFTESRQCLHDKLADTMVVKA